MRILHTLTVMFIGSFIIQYFLMSSIMANKMENIKKALNILRLKNDRNRYSTLAEEIILGCAEGIETSVIETNDAAAINEKTRDLVLVNLLMSYLVIRSLVGLDACRLT